MTRDSVAQWLPSSNFNSGHASRKYIFIHTTEGGYAGSLNWLRGAAAGSSNGDSSTHYIISADGSKLAQLVDENDTSWAVGNLAWNEAGINIEQEGYAAKGGFSDGLYRGTGELVSRIAQRWNIPLEYTGRTGKPGILGHMDVPDGHGGWGGMSNHDDPGSHYDFNKLLSYARGEASFQEVAPPEPESQYFKETQHNLSHGFKAFWEKFGGLGIFGYPISEEFTDTASGLTVQYFEKGDRFEWHPKSGGNPTNPWDVMLGNVGSEDLKDVKAKYPAAFAPRKQ